MFLGNFRLLLLNSKFFKLSKIRKRMILDLYMQGKPDELDGQLIISLEKEEMLKTVNHPYLKSECLTDLFSDLTTSLEKPKSGNLSPGQYSGYIPFLSQELENIKEHATNTEGNPMIQQFFYLSDLINILSCY